MRLMERKIRSLAMKGGRTETACKVDLQRKAHENSLLIHELNELRTEKRALQNQVRNLELKLRQAEQKLDVIQTNPSSGAGAAAPKLPRVEAGTTNSSAATPTAPVRSASPLPAKHVSKVAGPGGVLRKGPSSHMSAEDKQKMQNLLLAVDLNNQQIQMQKLENKILRDQVQKLVEERQAMMRGTGSPGMQIGIGDDGVAASKPATVDLNAAAGEGTIQGSVGVAAGQDKS